MGKTLEQYLAGLTGEQMSAAMLKFWAQAGGMETGAETLERYRAGQLRMRFEEIARQQPAAKRPLVVTFIKIKTLCLYPYKAEYIEDAIIPGAYDNRVSELLSVARQFASDEVGLANPVNVELVEFKHSPNFDEMLAWAKAMGKKPILPKHLYAIGIQHPDEQRKASIVALGSVRHGGVLCLHGDGSCRHLHSHAVGLGWGGCLFGFFSE